MKSHHFRFLSIVLLFAGLCLFLTACSSLFDSYLYGAECRNCNINSSYDGFEIEQFAVCENHSAICGVGCVYFFQNAPFEEIQIDWAEADETDGTRADYFAVCDVLREKRSIPEKGVTYYTKKVGIHVPDFLKGRKLNKILFDFYHDKVIVAYKIRNEDDMPADEVRFTSDEYPIFERCYLEDGTPYDADAPNFPEYFKKNPTASEEDYQKEQRRLYDAFREKFPGKSDSDFLMFLRYVQRTPFLPGGADSPYPRIEFDVKYRSYVIPDWMKPYENVPLEDIFGTE